METAINVVGLSKHYLTKNRNDIIALNNVTISFEQSSMVFVVGKSGAGKTTLINMIGGLDKPTSGNILYDSSNIDKFSNKELNVYRSCIIGFIFQDFYLLEEYDVLENIKFAVRFQENDEKIVEKRALKALKDIGILELANRKISELSGGQMQKVTIARVLAKNVEIILCDEPTGNLDSEASKEIMKLLKKISLEKLVIVVSHNEDYANEFGTRIIRLDNGGIVDDTNSKNIVSDKDVRHERIQGINYQRFRLFDSFKIIKNTLTKNLLSKLLIIILLISTFTIFSVIYSLSQYSPFKTFVNTLKFNDYYVIPITRYNETSVYYNDEIILYGPLLEYEKVTIDDISIVNAKLKHQIPIYPSYFFNKNFQDFIDYNFKIDSTYRLNTFAASYFKEIIVVDDFEKFNVPIRFGRTPIYDDEVLIYDYMAYHLIDTNAMIGISSMEDIIGYTLIDKDTGISLKISGILKSYYERYQYCTGNSNNYPFEKVYLASLQSIYALPAIVEKIQNEENSYSINNITFQDTLNKIDYDDNNFRKMVFTKNIQNFDFIGETQDNLPFGFLISNHQLAQILGINVDQISADYNISDIIGLTKNFHFGQEEDKLMPLFMGIGIYGVYESDDLDENNLYLYTKNEVYIPNGTFRKLYLSLGTDWNKNEDILKSFQWPNKPLSFFEENKEYEYIDYAEYTAFNIIIEEANGYLILVRSLGSRLTNILIITTILGVSLFSFHSIKKNKYRIGVFKSLGASNKDITLIFGMEIVAITILSYIISIGFTMLIMNSINQDFNSGLSYDMIFFNLSIKDFLVSLVVIMLIVVLSTIYPLVNLLKKTPIQLMKQSKKV